MVGSGMFFGSSVSKEGIYIYIYISVFNIIKIDINFFVKISPIFFCIISQIFSN